MDLDGLPAPPVTMPSQARARPLAVQCTRCGRPTEPGSVWNVCRACIARAGVGGSLCAACRAPLGFGVRHGVHLCAPCQAWRYVGPRAKHGPRTTNPYPAKSSRVAHAYPPALAPPPPPPPRRPRPPPLPAPPLPPPPPLLQFSHPPPLTLPLQSRAAQRHDSSRHRLCGCGARLPPHVRVDVCAVCSGTAAGAHGRVTPWRGMSFHPHTGVSGSQQRTREARGLQARTSRTNEDWDDEVDLVYPDDVATTTTVPETETKGDASRVEDEDVELELVYPEDVVEIAPPSKPRPPAKRPTTLRQLFSRGLRTIPSLRDAPADDRPPRRCRMQGCEEALPAQTSMERCVKCSINDWRRRKSEAKDARCLKSTDVPVRDERATADLAHPPFSSSPRDGLALDRDHPPISGWDSDLTQLSSDSEPDSASDPESEADLVRGSPPQGDAKGPTIRIPLLVHRLPPDRMVRKCANKRCNIALPADDPWKTCDACRRAQRRAYQRKRLEKKRRSAVGLQMMERPGRELSPEGYEEAALTPEISRACLTEGCATRIPLPDFYRWKSCPRCYLRRKQDARVETERAGPSRPEVVPRFPAYQNRGTLVCAFGKRVVGFVEGLLAYLGARMGTGRDGRVPMAFVFVGEYSVVTGPRGWGGGDEVRAEDAGMEAMRREVSGVVTELERALRMTFSPGEALAIDAEGGMIMRFTCSLELIAHLRPLSSGTPSNVARDACSDAPLAPVPLVKTLSGELEAVVVPDESHRLFHGRRTVIRYSMLG